MIPDNQQKVEPSTADASENRETAATQITEANESNTNIKPEDTLAKDPEATIPEVPAAV